MLRMLLILITLATLSNNVTNCGSLGFKDAAALFAPEDEDGKNMKSNEKGGKYNSDQMHDHFAVDFPHLFIQAKSSAPFSDQKNYCGFHNRPNTPPPNRI